MSGGVALGSFAAFIGAAATSAGKAGDQVLHWGGIIAIVAGFAAAIYSAKLKATLQAAEGSADAWKDERDAAVAKADRLEVALREAEADRRALAARTDLTDLRGQMSTQHAELLAALEKLTAATLHVAPPEPT